MTERTKLILKLVEDKRITVDEAGILLEPEPQPLQWYPYQPITTDYPYVRPWYTVTGINDGTTQMPEA